MKRYIFFSTLILLAGILAYHKWSKIKAKSAEKNVSKSTSLPFQVDAFIVGTKPDIQRYTSLGTIVSDNDVVLKNEVSGIVKEIYAQEGQYLRKGSLILKFEDADIQAEKSKIKIGLQQAKKDLDRLQGLVTSQAVSQADVDVASTKYDMYKADLDFIESKIKKTEVRAPFEGKLGLTDVTTGMYLSAGSNIAGLVDTKRLAVEFEIPAAYIEFVHKGKVVEWLYESKTYQTDTLLATIYAYESKVDANLRMLKVRAWVKSENRVLLPGMYVQVFLPYGENTDAIFVPTLALIPDFNKFKLFVARNGKAYDTLVTIGRRTPYLVQIKSGLKKGDTLLTTGIQQLKRGQSVHPIVHDSFLINK